MALTRRRGFTLIEILVVVSIIVILIAILLPALSGVRKQAQATNTQAELNSLKAAIEIYATAFNGAYPGPVREDVVANSTDFNANQNLLLGLAIAWKPSSSWTGNDPGLQSPMSTPFASGIVGDTVMSPNLMDYSVQALGKTGKPFAAPLSLKKSDIYIDQTLPNCYMAVLAKFPVIVDRFADPLPILYYRKNPGMDTMPPTLNAGSVAYYAGSNSKFISPVKLPDHPTPWLLSTTKVECRGQNDFTTDLTMLGQILSANNKGDSTGVPRGGYVLISAGMDRVYGPAGGVSTGRNDDIIMEGGN